jgi:hypothetical protein
MFSLDRAGTVWYDKSTLRTERFSSLKTESSRIEARVSSVARQGVRSPCEPSAKGKSAEEAAQFGIAPLGVGMNNPATVIRFWWRAVRF